MGLLQELERRRVSAELTDERFAAQLGVSRPYWSAVRAGHRRINAAFLAAIVRHYPDLSQQVLWFLQRRSPNNHTTKARRSVAESNSSA